MTIALAPSATSTPNASVSWARSYLIVGLVALAAGLAVIFYAFRAQGLVNSEYDPYAFGAMGSSIAHGDGLAPFGSLIQRRAPLYPLMIGALYRAFGEQPLAVQLAQCLLLAGTTILVFDIGRRVFNQRTGVVAALVCAFNPMLLRYVADLQLETLLTFLFTLTIWCTVRFCERPTVFGGVAIGVAAGLASLTKSVAFPYPFLFAAGLLLVALLGRRRSRPSVPWAGLAAMFFALFLVISPWTIRNYFATGGHFVLLSSGASDAFLRGYIFTKPEYATLRLPPYTYAENESNQLFESLSSAAGTVWQRDDYETDQILNRAAVQQLVADPGAFVRKFGVGLFTFWYEMTSLTNSIIAGGLALVSWVLAIIGLRRSLREERPAWLLILPA
ncbi:MAG: glycosyltransferase family 39 protein, partial [Chloroflexi bacterium]|nr:glycosyltransferase family 39 protein [Chloroflexota bacterium]